MQTEYFYGVLVTGALVGWLAGLVMKDRSFGITGNIIVGIIGAFFGLWLASILGLVFNIILSLLAAAIGAAVLFFIVSWVKSKTRIFTSVSRAPLPTIYLIQASDAPRHTSKLQEVLQALKTENRIDGFTTLGVEDDLSSLTDYMEEDDLILIVLTRGMESQREQINNPLKAFKTANPGAGIAEIIVDNVPYENIFYTLPESLRPIRDQEDKDVAWSGIEQSLNDMFPPPPPPPELPELPDVNLPEWLRGTLEWPWESPGRWHGALFLGIPAVVFVTVALYLLFPNEFERDTFSMILLILFVGVLYGVAGGVCRMRKATLFFAITYAVGVMVLLIVFWGTDDQVVGNALAFGGPISAVVGATIGRLRSPARLSGMIFMGLWPWLVPGLVDDQPFVLNSVIIALVLCFLAWVKPIEPQRAVKTGAVPFALNLAGIFLFNVVIGVGRGPEGNAMLLMTITVLAAACLGFVYWLNKKKYLEDV